MALIDQKLTDRTETASAGPNSFIHVVDPSDITDSAEGTSLKIKKSNYLKETGDLITVENPVTETTTTLNEALADVSAGGGGGAGVWGSITGDIEDQTDLQSALDAKQDALTFDTVPTNGSTNPVESNGVFDALATTLASANTYSDGLVVGLWDDRGSFNASVNAYPSSGGSGTAGAIKKGDIWTVSVAGVLPTSQNVEIGDVVRALIDTPGNTQANWAIQQNNIGYTAENSANKTDTVVGNTASSILYLSVKGYYDYLIGFTWFTESLFGSWIIARTAKTTPVDADTLVISDSADSNKAKKVTWLNIKATLKTYFDTLYSNIFSGTTNYIGKFTSATTIAISRLFDDGTYFGIGTERTPTKDITLGNQDNRVIGVEESSNTAVGKDLVIEAGRTTNYAYNANFNTLSQTSRAWSKMSAHSNGNIYACTRGGSGDIYMQTAGTGNFNSLGVTLADYFGITCAPNGNVYICQVGSDIYMQTAGAGAFNALSQTSRVWSGMASTSGNNIYACVYGGGIYMQTAGSGTFNSLSQATRNWRGLAYHSNGNVYAIVDGGDIYIQTGGAGTFTAIGGTSRAWTDITCHPNGNVYACVNNGDIYMQTGGAGAFNALSQTTRLWAGLCSATNGNTYASVDGGSIYMQSSALGSDDLDGGTLYSDGGTGKGEGQSRYIVRTGQKTVSGTDMQILTERAIFDEEGNVIFPTLTKALIGSEPSGKTAITKEYLEANTRKILYNNTALSANSPSTGQQIIRTCTINADTLNPDGFALFLAVTGFRTVVTDQSRIYFFISDNIGTLGSQIGCFDMSEVTTMERTVFYDDGNLFARYDPISPIASDVLSASAFTNIGAIDIEAPLYIHYVIENNDSGTESQVGHALCEYIPSVI